MRTSQIDADRRLIGLDIGDRRIGVAVSDPLGIVAQPVATIQRDTGWYAALDQALAPYRPGLLVVGWPLGLDGQPGERSIAYQRLGRRLASRYQCPLQLWDERWSTHAVERVLVEGGVRRKERRTLADRLAAAWILQGYLEYRQRRSTVEPT